MIIITYVLFLFVSDEFYALDNDLSYLLHYEQNF